MQKSMKTSKKLVIIIVTLSILLLVSIIVIIKQKQTDIPSWYQDYIEDYRNLGENIEKYKEDPEKADYYRYFHSYSGDYTRGYEQYYKDKKKERNEREKNGN
jgi:hypothetical protein